MFRQASFALICFALSAIAQGQDLGTRGETFPIVEKNMIEAMQERVKELVDSGEWDVYQKKFTTETIDKIKAPRGIELPHVTTELVRMVDPSVMLNIDIQLPDGKYVARQGDMINPLKQMNLNHDIAFIDGRDEKQINWAIEQRKKNPKTLVLLVTGNWYELSVKHKMKFWFDQTGEFVNRMDIQRTPSLVSQNKLSLKVHEIVL